MDGSGRPTGGERRKENTSAGYKYISNFIFWCVVPPPTPLLAREVWLKKMTRHLKKTGGGGQKCVLFNKDKGGWEGGKLVKLI